MGNIRIDPKIAEGLMQAVMSDLSDDRIAARINEENDFKLAAIRTAQDVLTMSTLAQTMSPDASFNTLLAGRVFSGGDADLQVIGQALAEKIAAQPRIQDPEISDTLLSVRYKEIFTAI